MAGLDSIKATAAAINAITAFRGRFSGPVFSSEALLVCPLLLFSAGTRANRRARSHPRTIDSWVLSNTCTAAQQCRNEYINTPSSYYGVFTFTQQLVPIMHFGSDKRRSMSAAVGLLTLCNAPPHWCPKHLFTPHLTGGAMKPRGPEGGLCVTLNCVVVLCWRWCPITVRHNCQLSTSD